MTNERPQIVKMFNNQQIRIIENNGEPWFVATDICSVLSLQNASKAISMLAKDERMTITLGYSHSAQRGGARFLILINEPGLYRLVFKSTKPEAEALSRWVYHEVLPQIRKTGSYNAKVNTAIATLANRITSLVMENLDLKAKIGYLSQYTPLDGLGQRSEHNGLPRNFYRKAAYVSRRGRRLKPQQAFRQLDLFADLPALQEAKNALAITQPNNPFQLN